MALLPYLLSYLSPMSFKMQTIFNSFNASTRVKTKSVNEMTPIKLETHHPLVMGIIKLR